MKLNKLTKEEERVIVQKETEMPFSGEYDDFYQPGMFVCRRCNNPLYSSKAKFNAFCGWPAFDEEFKGSIKRLPDPNGWEEIACAKCNAHLGHVFEGEHFTRTNKRHCVNSLSIKFVPEKEHTKHENNKK
jgi:peptide-methionine (R)-S-oxide reductase